MTSTAYQIHFDDFDLAAPWSSRNTPLKTRTYTRLDEDPLRIDPLRHPRRLIALVDNVLERPRRLIARFEEAVESRMPQKLKRAPWLGLICLTGSAATVLMSLVVLLVVDNHPVWSNDGINKIMRPASLLSALLSANSIFLHVAMNEGVTNAWWFRATKRRVTLSDLHDTWSHGTSMASALSAGRKMNYVSLATIILGLIPINAFLLQGAIATKLSQEESATTVTVPMVRRLSGCFSACYDSDGSGPLDVAAGWFGTYWAQVINLAMSRNAQYAYFGSFLVPNTTDEYFDFGCPADAVCIAKAQGVGFDTECEHSKRPYDLMPTKNESAHGTVFSSSFYWNASQPNKLFLDLLYKSDTSCVGAYEVRECVLTAALIEYPVQMQMNNTSVYPGPYYSLPVSSRRQGDKIIEILHENSADGVLGPVYGGIGILLGNYFNSQANATIKPDLSGSYTFNGQLPLILSPSWESNENNNKSDPNGYCNMTFKYPIEDIGFEQSLDNLVPDNITMLGYVDWNVKVDLADVVLEPLRRAMFLSSVYQGSAWWGSAWAETLSASVLRNNSNYGLYNQDVPATVRQVVTRYQVRFYLWGASLAITYLVIAAILPTFWGFWLLKRKPTMSPVDVARAFNAPLLAEDDVATKSLLKQVGHVGIHELSQSPPQSRHTSLSDQSFGYPSPSAGHSMHMERTGNWSISEMNRP